MKMSLSPALLLIFISSFILTNCKKGPDDPKISFRTRKARVVGEWRLKSGNASFTISKPGTSPFNQAHQFDGSSSTINETESGNVAYIYKAAYLLSLKCKKDGTFEMTENYGGKNLVASGRWNFTGGVGKTKNKEELVFIIESVGSGYTDGHIFNKLGSEFTYKILELRNKEMVIETGSSPFSNSSGQTLDVEAHYLLTQ